MFSSDDGKTERLNKRYLFFSLRTITRFPIARIYRFPFPLVALLVYFRVFIDQPPSP